MHRINEEEYKYIDKTEILKLSPEDDLKVYRNFAKDFTNLRALIKGEDIYLWDAKQATHDQIADGLFGEDSELDNQFMFDTKYNELDDYSIRNTIDMYKFDKGTALGEKWYNDFFKYYEIIKTRLGVDFTKEGLEKVEYLKSLKTSNLKEDLKGYRYILTFDGEPQGIGMFQGLSEIDRDEEYIESLEDLFKELEIPEEVFIKNRFTTSYFTEKGLEKFKSAIDTLQQAYREYSGFDIELITEDIPEDKIVYQDEYQIIIKGIKEGENIFETLNREIERYL